MEPSKFSYQFYQTTATAWDAMYEAIRVAEKSIYWEVYIFVDDFVGNKFLQLLSEKARAGVEVKIIIDAYGSSKFSEAAEKYFKEAGVDFKKYNRLVYPQFKFNSWLTRILHRNHRKVLIVDERVAFLGGVNIADRFNKWDDIFIKISGPITWPLLRGFAKSYVSAGGERKAVRHLLHPMIVTTLPTWRDKFKFILHSPTRYQIPKTKRLYLQALQMAKESVNLLTPYFVPDKQFLKAVAIARRRGVKVNIFLPLRPDHKLMELIARAYYSLTANLGANLYFLPEMHHGKAMTVDNTLGMVGSINITPRSFTKQEESAVSFSDTAMVEDLNLLFNNLKIKAEPFDAKRWQRRSWWSRFREWVAKHFADFV
jgi:cardiolipin synthase